MPYLVGRQLGEYQLTQYIGSGAFADVYLGIHTYLDKQVALKILKGPFTEQEVQAFLREARILVQLEHPHIVRLITFNIESIDGLAFPYLIMEYAPRGSLDKQYPRGTVLLISRIVDYVKQVADALQYAHMHKVIHRDIKPANFLVGENRQILLTDFGIAVMTHRTSSWEEQHVAGTYTYMAPEQFYGKAEEKSDQYSLAAVVYEWLCGTPPFTGNMAQLQYQHLNTAPPTFGEKMLIAPTVENVVLRALAKDPNQRFSNIMDFAQALEQSVQTGIEPSPLPKTIPAITIANKLANTVKENPKDVPSGIASVTSTNAMMHTKPSDKYICPSCFEEFYIGHCKIVSTLKIDPMTNQLLVLKIPPSIGIEGLHARFFPEALTGRKYVQEDAKRECPHCNYLLPYNMERVQNIMLTVVGDHFSGMSTYFAVLIHALMKGSLQQGEIFVQATCLTLNIEREYIQDIVRPLFENHESLPALLAPSADQKQQPLIYELMVRVPSLGLSRRVNLILYDSNEINFTIDRIIGRNSQHIFHANAYIFFVDPLNIQKLRERLISELSKEYFTHGTTATYLLHNMINLYERFHASTAKKRWRFTPVAVTLAKADLLKELFDSTNEIPNFLNAPIDDKVPLNTERIDKETRELLSQFDEGVALLKSTDRLPLKKFFPVSATGCSSDKNGIYPKVEPYRCLDPLFWIIRQVCGIHMPS